MKKTTLSFNDRPEHISEYLTHWTGRGKFEILKIIIETKELKFSPNLISFPDNTTTLTSQMICFTDTPIKHSIEHCKKYGSFGISFNKEKLVTYGANPVLYLMDTRKSYHSYLLEFAEAIRSHTNNEQALLLNWFRSSMQPYNTKPNDINHFPEFFEREWRIAGRVLPFHWLENSIKQKGEYNEPNYAGKIRPHQNSDDINDVSFFLPFDPNIIENIVVPEGSAKEAEQLLIDQKLDCELISIA